MLDFGPERVGHACYFDEEDWKKLKARKIPVRTFCNCRSYISTTYIIMACILHLRDANWNYLFSLIIEQIMFSKFIS